MKIEIPVLLGNKRYVVGKDVDGSYLVTGIDLDWDEVLDNWNNNIMFVFPELLKLRVISTNQLIATKKKNIVSIYDSSWAVDRQWPTMELDLDTDVLRIRGKHGELSADESSFARSWNQQLDIAFRFRGTELIAVVNGTEMTLIQFMQAIPNGEEYIMHAQRFLER